MTTIALALRFALELSAARTEACAFEDFYNTPVTLMYRNAAGHVAERACTGERVSAPDGWEYSFSRRVVLSFTSELAADTFATTTEVR